MAGPAAAVDSTGSPAFQQAVAAGKAGTLPASLAPGGILGYIKRYPRLKPLNLALNTVPQAFLAGSASAGGCLKTGPPVPPWILRLHGNETPSPAW